MARNTWAQGLFTPKNPQKYLGTKTPKFRSSWEFSVMTMFDENNAITAWASESIAIPYKNPVTGKISRYIPDFFVVYTGKNGQSVAEIVEVKPASQTSLEEAKSKHDKLHAIVNAAKWASARAYCKQNGYTFRILTERDIYTGVAKPKIPKRRRK